MFFSCVEESTTGNSLPSSKIITNNEYILLVGHKGLLSQLSHLED